MENFGFIKDGDVVRAKRKVTDSGEEWGTVVAEIGDMGKCIHAQADYWPTVRFQSGIATIVCEVDVEKV